MQTVIFHPEARHEMRHAANYYDDSRRGLGDRFLDAVENGVKQVQRNPYRWRKIRGEVRRCLIPRVPYGVLYVADEEHILIVAVMHLHRHPDYWLSRLEDIS